MKISIIIPTYNEAANIAGLVKDLFRYAGDQPVEVIVSDGGSNDATMEIAAQAGASVLKSSKPGRAAQMNYASNFAHGDVLYFVHADVGINPDYFKDIEQAVSEGFDAGCYRFRFGSSRAILKINNYFTRFDRLMCRGGDQTLFVTRKLFSQLNGFNEYYTIMEDYDIIIRIWKMARFKIIPKEVIVSARKYENNSWLRVQLANLTAFTMFYLKKEPASIALKYKSMLDYR
ncbi:TIGR04283 family arsenosugar biosynthesis glycosyltransferase [Dyadobacter fanqingshengii]|uniref:TIGR04283 family arsenosugar biosynthesis glycosyltransferase n=1 Tax=Dyadobacter fanqingshengii TaxID=2906443 RepID=A0A9X1PBW3_9BACT|nr:TIGR04283 family arsenosugar biosynthesis glycosyltransferase [Dyadobacter fanqingshengii]MCF0040422.1 TIGR04283 family arsenosugar biosynthesis glycosyltransferase [Dyadobacter fanqingshengii]USJ37836.1 TIGR04283 family arsenosugar biosynthesis glycosyltransferase [Dyadobacter fanqingshengii]